MRKDKMENFEILPTEENLIKTLEADLLGRNQQLSYFYNLLLAQKGASTIAVDGKWGSGKTFFIKQSTMVINAKNPVSIIEKEKREKILSKLFLTESDNYMIVILLYIMMHGKMIMIQILLCHLYMKSRSSWG